MRDGQYNKNYMSRYIMKELIDIIGIITISFEVCSCNSVTSSVGQLTIDCDILPANNQFLLCANNNREK